MTGECNITPHAAFAASSNVLPAAALETFAPNSVVLDVDPAIAHANMVDDRARHLQAFGSVTLYDDITIDEVFARIQKGDV